MQIISEKVVVVIFQVWLVYGIFGVFLSNKNLKMVIDSSIPNVSWFLTWAIYASVWPFVLNDLFWISVEELDE